jgi:hypothetical protein
VPPSIGDGVRAMSVGPLTDHGVAGAGRAMINERTREVAGGILAWFAVSILASVDGWQ